jgi:hypothetical protein
MLFGDTRDVRSLYKLSEKLKLICIDRRGLFLEAFMTKLNGHAIHLMLFVMEGSIGMSSITSTTNTLLLPRNGLSIKSPVSVGHLILTLKLMCTRCRLLDWVLVRL